MNCNTMEFKYKVKNDGKIIIIDNKIIKKKKKSRMTIDLQYDAKGNVFIDSDKNVYYIATNLLYKSF